MQSESSSSTSLTEDTVLAPAAPPAANGIAPSPARRRGWRWAMVCGLMGGLLAISVLWFVHPSQYTAVALLKISAKPEVLVFPAADKPSARSFEIYKGTQQQLLTSDLVLTTALRKPETAELAAMQLEDDPVRWLARNLRVDFPRDAEIMRVSLTTSQPEEAAGLVNAVVDAYMTEVVDAEQHKQKQRLDELERLYTEKETEMRNQKTELKQLAEQLGTGDTGALALRQQITLQQYAEARSELSRLRAELQRAKADLQIQQARIKAMESAPQQVPDKEEMITADETLMRLLERIEEIDDIVAALRKNVKEPLLTKSTADYAQIKKILLEKVASRRRELSAKLPKTSRANLAPQIAELNARIEILDAQEKLVAKDLDMMRQKAEQVGNSSIDVEMKRSELVCLDKVLAPIAEEREKAKIELRSTRRISLIQRADAPRSSDPLFVLPDLDPSSRRQALVALIVLAATLLPAGLVLCWTGRRRRLPA